MDPKVLTLFDDDDFQPPPPKPGPTGGKGSGKKKDLPDVQATAADSEVPAVAGKGEDTGLVENGAEKRTSDEPAATQPEGIEADTLLDEQMKAALIQADYARYVYKELPAQPQPQVKGSGIVFEGVVARKKQGAAPPARAVADEEESGSGKTAAAEGQDSALPEWRLESRYYSIGEVARLFGVNTSHIRFWTTQFNLKLRTTRKGDRLYNVGDIEQLRLIHHLVKEKKHTIKGAKEKLKARTRVAAELDLRTSLTRLKDILTEMRDKL